MLVQEVKIETSTGEIGGLTIKRMFLIAEDLKVNYLIAPVS